MVKKQNKGKIDLTFVSDHLNRLELAEELAKNCITKNEINGALLIAVKNAFYLVLEFDLYYYKSSNDSIKALKYELMKIMSIKNATLTNYGITKAFNLLIDAKSVFYGEFE